MSSSSATVQSLQVMSAQEQSMHRKLEGLRRDLGPEIMRELADPTVIEVMLNPDGKVWRDRLGEGMSEIGYVMPESQSEKLLGNIASMLGTVITRENPILEGELPLDGSRFEGIFMPVVARPAFAIRKKASLIFTLDDYERQGIISHKDDPANFELRKSQPFVEMVKGMSHAEILRTAIKLRKNILVVGGTGSGKTTLLNALSHAISLLTPEHRIVLIEDTGEVQCAAKNLVQMRANKDATITQLLSATLRMRPDRICVGEVRGPEALALLKLLNTGHPGGFATLHADSPEKGLKRLERLIEENPGIKANPHEIAEAINVVVFIGKSKNLEAGRKVSEMIVVEGFDEQTGRYKTTRV
jgi:type IV secretion system protein TrbB